MFISKFPLLSDEELLTLARRFSEREGDLKDQILHWDFGPIMEMRFDPLAKNYLFGCGEVPFHWDGAFHREPRLLLFYCLESAGEGGETLFCDTEKLWESLPEKFQERCRSVRLTYRTEKLAHYGGEISLPLVQTHPTTGKTILRMAERVVTALNPVELTISGAQDGEELYSELAKLLYDERFLYEHRWSPGDLIVCDNHTYLHGRRPLRGNTRRRFKRVQIL